MATRRVGKAWSTGAAGAAARATAVRTAAAPVLGLAGTMPANVGKLHTREIAWRGREGNCLGQSRGGHAMAHTVCWCGQGSITKQQSLSCAAHELLTVQRPEL